MADNELASGSFAALALVFAPAQQRQRLTAGCQLIEAMAFGLQARRHPEAAGARLAWWQSELERFAMNEPTHPATKALAEFSLPAAQVNYWLELLQAQAVTMNVDLSNPDRAWTAGAQMGSGHSALAQLIGTPDAADTYRSLGQAAWVTTRLLAEDRPNAEATQTLAALALDAQNQVHQTLSTPDGPQHRFALTLNALYRSSARRLKSTPTTSGDSPLKRLWVAWTTARTLA